MMQDLQQLRLFYNHTIHPELMRLEKRRHRMLLLLGSAFLLLLCVLFVQISFNVLPLTLVLIMPLVLFIRYIYAEIEAFRRSFKPKVVNLLLDFIDNDVTFNVPMKYVQDGAIDPSVFKRSRLFNSNMPDYFGEDYISGEMGELTFEMSELSVKEFSPVRNRLDNVFHGVFLHARFVRPVQTEEGEILVLPRGQRHYLSHTIKAFTVNGARQFDPQSERFKNEFITYATNEANIRGFLSYEMQQAIWRYRQREGKDVYMSFVGDEIFVAVSQDKDLLEPVLWQSNTSFELIREFYEDLILLLSIILDIDANN